MPEPKWVVAVGDCAACGGLFADSPVCAGGVEKVLPVALRIAGCPPPPVALLRGLLSLLRA
jgi:Ni,Fe-hydrogenase III small subunit